MLIDSHAHIQMRPFSADRTEVVGRARSAGMTALVTVGTDLETSRLAIDLAARTPEVYATAGIHPHDATALDDRAVATLRTLAADERIVAIGEIGLDYYRDRSPREVQRAAFERQLELAAELSLPVVVHDRDAHEDTHRLLETWARGRRASGAGGPLGVRHCWSGPVELALAFQEIGFMVSIAGNVTYPTAAEIQTVASQVADEWLLVETDCPYLTPVPFRGKRNEPALITHTVQFVARLRGQPATSVAELTASNAIRLFRLPMSIPTSAGGTL